VNDLDALLPAIASGDARTFGRWLALAERTLRESLRPFAAAVDTEAALQEALLRIWQVAPRCVPDGRPNALLRLGLRIARNLCISEARRLRAAPLDDAALEQASVDSGEVVRDKGPDPLLARTLADCREKLPEKPAAALAERVRSAGAEPDEALAARLGMRTNTFLQNFTRARKLLADCLKDRGVDLAMELS
jgi:RNA polymerase sigma-70 factor (ECF subfamily)